MVASQLFLGTPWDACLQFPKNSKFSSPSPHHPFSTRVPASEVCSSSYSHQCHPALLISSSLRWCFSHKDFSHISFLAFYCLLSSSGIHYPLSSARFHFHITCSSARNLELKTLPFIINEGALEVRKG